MFANYLTTIPGVLALLTIAYNAWQTKTVNWEELQTALVAIGVIAAKDWNVTGGTRDQ